MFSSLHTDVKLQLQRQLIFAHKLEHLLLWDILNENV